MESDAPWPRGASSTASDVHGGAPSYREVGGPESFPDGVWRAADEGDPLDLARLATREGAQGLLDVAARGGRPGAVALAALPYADDGVVALGWLCTMLTRAREEDIPVLVAAVAGISARPPRDAEQLALGDMEACLPIVSEVATTEHLPARTRDLAASARRMLAEHLPEPPATP